MPLDPAISLGVQTPQANVNPIGTVGAWAGVMNQLNQVQLFNQTMQARYGIGNIMASAPDTETGLQQIEKSPYAPFAAPFIGQMREIQQTIAQTEGQYQTQAQSGLQAFMKSLPAALRDPTQFPALIKANMATLSPEARRRDGPAIADLTNAIFGELPDDPRAAQDLVNKRLAAWSVAGGVTPENLQGVLGTPVTQNVPGYGLVSGVRQPAQYGGGLGISSEQPFPQQVTGPFGPQGATGVRYVTPPALGVGGGAVPGRASGMAPGETPPTRPPGGPGGAEFGQSAPSPYPTGPTPLQTQGYKDMAEYRKNLNDLVSDQQGMMQVISEARNAMTQFRPGAGAGVYESIAKVAQAFGAGNDLVDKISNGNLGATQEFEKLMVQNVMGQIKSSLPSGSRLAQYEFRVFNEKNPNINTDPRAIDKIFDFWTKLYNYNTVQQREMNNYLANPQNDPNQWPQVWQQTAQRRGYNYMQPSLGGIPMAAMNALKQQPGRVREFDEMYGAGLGEEILKTQAQ